MSNNLKRILVASVGAIVFAGRKHSRGINMAITRLLLFATLLFITSATTAAVGAATGVAMTLKFSDFVAVTEFTVEEM